MAILDVKISEAVFIKIHTVNLVVLKAVKNVLVILKLTVCMIVETVV